MADYLDAGYDPFLSKADPYIAQQRGYQELDPLQFEQFTQEVSGSKVQGGIIKSRDGKLIMDLQTALLSYSTGASDLIQLGTLPDGTQGLIVNDSQLNQLLKLTSGGNSLSSKDGSISFDLDKNIFIFKDTQGKQILTFAPTSHVIKSSDGQFTIDLDKKSFVITRGPLNSNAFKLTDTNIQIGDTEGNLASFLNFYDNDGNLQIQIDLDVNSGLFGFLRCNDNSFGATIWYESGTDQVGEICHINIDDGFYSKKPVRINTISAGAGNTPGSGEAELYTDNGGAGSKTRLIARFSSGTVVLATAP